MSPFEKAMEEYEEHFGTRYPYAIGVGFPGQTDEENIKIIRKSIASDTPVNFQPEYHSEYEY